MAAILKPWCESVYARANQLANEAGLKVPGYKLVEKMGRKTWASEKAAGFAIQELLNEAGEKAPEDIYNPAKLRTPLQVQKALKGIVEKDAIEVLTEVPSRGTILVSANDKREEVISGEDLLSLSENLDLFN